MSIETRLASRTEICASLGRDFEDVVTDLEEEALLMEQLGPEAPATPATPAEPVDEETTTTTNNGKKED